MKKIFTNKDKYKDFLKIFDDKILEIIKRHNGIIKVFLELNYNLFNNTITDDFYENIKKISNNSSINQDLLTTFLDYSLDYIPNNPMKKEIIKVRARINAEAKADENVKAVEVIDAERLKEIDKKKQTQKHMKMQKQQND